MAPEVVLKNYNEKCDLWSCGVLLYMILSGTAPFKGRIDEEILVKIERGRYTMEGERWEKISKEAKSFITKLLEYDYKKRISAYEAFNDPWILRECEKSAKLLTFEKSKQIIENMINWNKNYDALKLLVFLYLSRELIPNEQKAELALLFNEIDQKSDGILDFDELDNFCQNAGFDATQINIKELIIKNDINLSDYIEFSEFCLANYFQEIKNNKITTQMKHEIFEIFNNVFFISKNNQKKGEDIQKANLIEKYNEINENCENLVDEIMLKYDKNKNGRISYEEFQNVFNF